MNKKKYRTKYDRNVEELKEQYGKDIFEVYESKKSWGDPRLDTILGGLPNRVVELLGIEGGGKSTCAYKALADNQEKGKYGVLVDAENAYSTAYGNQMGIDNDKLLVIQENNMEKVMNIVVQLLGHEEVGLIVIDSLPALVPTAVYDDVVEKQDLVKKHVADRARLMSESLNIITKRCRDHHNSLIIINQLRMKIGPFIRNPKTTPGGRALKHYAMQRVEMTPVGRIHKTIKGVKTTIGNEVKIKAVKNKIKEPEVECTLRLIFGKGFEGASQDDQQEQKV